MTSTYTHTHALTPHSFSFTQAHTIWSLSLSPNHLSHLSHTPMLRYFDFPYVSDLIILSLSLSRSLTLSLSLHSFRIFAEMLKHPPRYFLFFTPTKLPHVLFQSRVQLINVNPIFHSFLNFWPYLLDFNAPILLRAVNFNIIHLLRVLHWDELKLYLAFKAKAKNW